MKMLHRLKTDRFETHCLCTSSNAYLTLTLPLFTFSTEKGPLLLRRLIPFLPLLFFFSFPFLFFFALLFVVVVYWCACV